MHPTLEELIEFVQGRMDPSSQAEVESHVEDCHACCELLRTAPNDTLLEQLIAKPRSAAGAPAKKQPQHADKPTRCQTAAELLAELEKSGILTPEGWAQAQATAQAQAPEKASSAARLAHALVAQELLTPWQAERLLSRSGSLTLDKYQLLSLLGSGGMAQVYLAKQVRLNRRVAIKLLPKTKTINGSYLERFHREAQLVAALDHKNIVRAFHADNVGQQHFLVMEYIEGLNLQDLVDRDGPLACELAVGYVAQAAEGLAHAAEAGIVHRDIKPANLLLDAEGTIKILDMGLGRLGEEADHSITQKYDDRLIGTTDYMAPEQAIDAHAVDSRADIYSLGATLYFLLTGQAPFPEGTVAERLLKHQREEPEPIRTLRPDCPPALAAICQQMMAKKTARRYQTAGETAQALRKWLANPHLIEVAPAPVEVLVHEPPARWDSRRIAAVAALVVLGVGLTGGALAARYGLISATPEPEPAPPVVVAPVPLPPDPAVVAVRSCHRMLAHEGLQLEPPDRWLLKVETQARDLLAQLEKGAANVTRCEAELAAFQKTYRETIVQAEQDQRTAAPKAPQTEAQKAVWLLPQHHHTFEMAVHQAKVSLIEGIQKAQTLAPQLESARAAAAGSAELLEALATLSTHGQPGRLSTKDEVARQATALTAWGERLVREELPLARQGSALTAEVTIGAERLVIDVQPAATNNQLSDAQARQLGLRISPAAPRVSLLVGRDEKGAFKYVHAAEVAIERVTLGPLTNTSVRFLVIPAEHAAVRPALSAAFLYGRKCDVDAKAGVLKILRLRDAVP